MSKPHWIAGSAASMTLGGVLLAGMADWLFYQQPIGWTAGLFLTLSAAAVFIKRPRRAAIVPLLLVLALAAVMVVQPSPLTILLAGLALMSLAASARAGWTWRCRQWGQRWLWYAVGPVVVPVKDLRLMHQRPSRRGIWRLAKWALPVLLGLVFLGLFRLANPIIADWLDELRVKLAEWFVIGRMLLWFSVLLGAWALWRQRPLKQDDDGEHPLAQRSMNLLDQVLPPDVVVRCLLLFNVLFAVQTILDGRYLWGGAALPTGMTYAQYAHRGAYPLVATALLAGLFVMATFRAGGAAERSAWARRLVYLWIAQNLLLLAAAVHPSTWTTCNTWASKPCLPHAG